MAAKKHLIVGDLRGGRNGADAPLALSENQCVEAMNVDFFEGTMGHKRNGASSVSLEAGTTGSAFTSYVSSLFFASSGYTDYLFAIDGTTPSKAHYYDTGHSGWTTVWNGDELATMPHAINAVTFNNRTYVCYDSAVNRLHFWALEDGLDHHGFHRVGIPAPAYAPTTADQGSGSYTATLRYYRVAWIYKPSTTIVNRSELSAVRTFTPSGSGTSARVTRPSVPGDENISHWELYAGTDGAVFRLIATIAIATTTYDDSTAPASYAGDAAPVVGANTVPGSWKYIATTGNRLLGVGNWEGGQQSRVWFTPVYGASDIGDAERVPTSNYIDLDAYDGDAATGIVGSFMGNTLVFKTRQVWRLVPTGDSTAPYSSVCLTKAIGCVAPKSIVVGEDENGNPAVYFMSHRGPYRLGTEGLEYCGRDVEDLTGDLNQSATVVCHAVWHPTKHQVWFWVARGSDAYPTERLVLDTHLCRRGVDGVRAGWVRQTGESGEARCSANYGATLTSGGKVNTFPYVGSSSTVNVMLRCDDATVTQDNAVSFQAYVKTKPYPLGGLGFNCSVGQSHLTAKASDDVTITQTLDRDYGLEVRTSTCSLTPEANETRVQRQFEGSDLNGAGVVQFQIGDAGPANNGWTLDALVVPYSQQEGR